MKTLILSLIMGFIAQSNFAQITPTNSSDSIEYEYATYVRNSLSDDVIIYSDGRMDFIKDQLLQEIMDSKVENALRKITTKTRYHRILFRMNVFKYLNQKNYELITSTKIDPESTYEEFIFRRKKANSNISNN